MRLEFHKYQGTGNDFIILDNSTGNYSLLGKPQVEFLCNRRFGIGADGLILLEKKEGFDFHMKYFNSDGNESSMCGNGGRCITAFANALKLINGSADFTAIDGVHQAVIKKRDPVIVKLKMNDVTGYDNIGTDLYLNTGSPHYVRFVNDVMKVNVTEEGRSVRNSERFREQGTNVNFVEPVSSGLKVRSYERGVEDETLSCGTGVTASVLAAVVKGIVKESAGKCEVTSMGGILNVYFKKTRSGFADVWLEGEAKFVYSGAIEI